jgi:DNA polymerase-3 subunit gamma/tau
MLGLSDRGAVRDLFAMLLAGDSLTALDSLRRQYDYGVDPVAVLRALLETVHGITLTKVGAADDPAQPVEERAARTDWAARLSFPVLHRLWQLVLKGHDEVARAALPIEAAEMALLRIVHASQLPDPGDLARRLAEGGATAPAPAHAVPAATPAPARAPAALVDLIPPDFEGLVTLLENNQKQALAARLHHSARLVRYDPPELVLSGSRPLTADMIAELAGALKTLTKAVWRITFEDVPGTPSLKERDDQAEEAKRLAAWDSPMVRAAREAFPGTELVDWPGKRSNA